MSTSKEHSKKFDKSFFMESFSDKNILKRTVNREPQIPEKTKQSKAPINDLKLQDINYITIPITPLPVPASLEKKETTTVDDQLKWNSEDQQLIDLFRKNKRHLPYTPYVLEYEDKNGKFPLHVNYPAAWYTKLEEQIAEGPQGDRAQNGLLQRDLKKLTEHLELLKNIGGN